jgi:hypothetical protein
MASTAVGAGPKNLTKSSFDKRKLLFSCSLLQYLENERGTYPEDSKIVDFFDTQLKVLKNLLKSSMPSIYSLNLPHEKIIFYVSPTHDVANFGQGR